MKDIDILVQEERDKRSQELFDKNESELTLEESLKLERYIHDISNPIWKPIIIDGKDTGYQISNTAEIKDYNGRKVKQYSSSSHYKMIWIRIKGSKNCKPKMIHRLVAEAFIPNPDNKPEVNHVNCKIDINWCGNLEWCIHKENIDYMIKQGHQIIGTAHKNSKSSDKQINDVCLLLEEGILSLSEISMKTGVSVDTVKKIHNGTGWKHISKKYMIDTTKRKQGPRYSRVSFKIIELVKKNLSNEEIILELNKSGLSNNITLKSIRDRIYHIRKQNLV